MPKPRTISATQLEKLLSILQDNKDIANNRLVGGPLGHQRVAKFWVEVAVTLNSFADGATKDAEQWKRYWHELKYRAKKKAAEARQHAAGTGGGPSMKPLTEIEIKILEIMGSVAYEGNPTAQIPIEIPSAAGAEIIVTSEPEEVPSTSAQAEPYPSREVEPGPTMLMEPPPNPTSNTVAESSQTRRDRRLRTSRVQRTQPRVRNVDDDVPAWARDYEERRLALDERGLALDERRLEIEQQRVELVQKNAESFQNLIYVVRRIAETLEKK